MSLPRLFFALVLSFSARLWYTRLIKLHCGSDNLDKTLQEIQKLIELMEPLEIEVAVPVADKERIAKWVTALVAKVYVKGLQDGKES